MSNNNEDSQKYDNKNQNDTHVMNNTELDNTKVLINKDNVLESKKAIYEYLPLQAHCNKYDIEKWHDWFCIPNYYINNNYVEGEKELVDIDTNDVSICYKPCYINDINDSLIIRKGNIKQCVYKSSYLKGKYSDYTIFDPFSIICLYGSTLSTIKDINKKGSYLYKLNEISKKKDNSNWNNEEYELAKDINTSDINIIDNVIKNPDLFISSIITDIEKSKEMYERYIKNIIDTLSNETSIKIKISDDILNFNNLLTSNDLYYMTYLNKISDNYGIDYAYEVSKSLNNNNTSSNSKISDKSTAKDIKKYVDFALKYSCYVCFSRQSEYYNNMISKVNIIKEDSIIKSPDRENVCELPNMEIDEIKSQNIILKNIEPEIDKNDIVLFSIYNSIYEYFKSFVYTFNVIIITILVIVFIIGICTLLNIIVSITYAINFLFLLMFELYYVLIKVISKFLYYFCTYFIVLVWRKKNWYISTLAFILLFISTIQYLVGNKDAYINMFNIFIDTFTSFIKLVKIIIYLMYKTSIVSLPITILVVNSYINVIMPQYSIITECKFDTAQLIWSNYLVMYKTNFYKDILTSYNLNILQYQNI